MRWVCVIVLLSFGSCVFIVPDWETRPKGLHEQHQPEFLAWTVPQIEGVAGDVVIFARANHAPDWRGAALEIHWDGRTLRLTPQPDLSWSKTVGLAAGKYTFVLRLVLHGEVAAERTVGLHLREREAVGGL